MQEYIEKRGSKVIKTFVFERTDTQQSTLIECQIDSRTKSFNLKQILKNHCCLTTHDISIYNPRSMVFQSLKELGALNGKVPWLYIQPSFVLIRFISKGSPSDADEQFSEEDENFQQQKEEKQIRSKERTIREGIELVKRWRELGLHRNIHNKKLSLHQAANIINISKKTLDDYYCQLRLGEQHHFDFSNRLGEKMGVLRNYLKDHTEQKDLDIRKKNRKHPTSLKMLESYDMSTHEMKGHSEDSRNQDKSKQGTMINYSEQIPQLLEKQQVPFLDDKQNSPEDEQSLLLQSINISPFPAIVFNTEDNFFQSFDVLFKQESQEFFDIHKNLGDPDINDESNNLK